MLSHKASISCVKPTSEFGSDDMEAAVATSEGGRLKLELIAAVVAPLSDPTNVDNEFELFGNSGPGNKLRPALGALPKRIDSDSSGCHCGTLCSWPGDSEVILHGLQQWVLLYKCTIENEDDLEKRLRWNI